MQKIRMHKLGAALLLFAFLLIPVATLFHYHDDKNCPEQSITSNDIVFSKCPVCDYLLQKQSKHLGNFNAVQLVVPVLKSVEQNLSPDPGIYNSYYQDLHYRGPPLV